MPITKKWINKSRDLPKSFNLANYAGTERFDARGWAQALFERQLLQVYNIRPDPESGAINDQFIHRVFKDPLFLQTPHGIQISKTDLGEPPIQHLTVRDLHLLSNFLLNTEFDKEAKEVRTYFDDYMTADKTTPKSLSESADAFKMKALDSLDAFPPRPGDINTFKIHLSVDMTCSNELLKQEFERVLISARAARDIDVIKKESFNDDNFKKWHDLAILPYLDLSLWAKANGVEIKPGVFSETIYKYSDIKRFGDSRTITETVKPKATKLMQREALKTLYVQAQEDLRRKRERKKPRLSS